MEGERGRRRREGEVGKGEMNKDGELSPRGFRTEQRQAVWPFLSVGA